MSAPRRSALAIPLIVAVLAMLSAAPVAAQTSPPPPAVLGPLHADPKPCAPDERLQQGDTAPRVPTTDAGNLSDKLARNDGVICPPPNVDTQMAAPPPGGGRTPVIPPPGSPGGDQSVKPK